MKKEDAKKSIKKITSDSASLEPSSLVTLFEIDISEIAITPLRPHSSFTIT
jgi:phage-related protein